MITLIFQEYSSYKATRSNQSSFCINVGNKSHPTWFPADQLDIVDGQLAKEKMEGDYEQNMLKLATRKPQQNKDLIMKQGLKVLGLNPLLPHFQVNKSSSTPTFRYANEPRRLD